MVKSVTRGTKENTIIIDKDTLANWNDILDLCETLAYVYLINVISYLKRNLNFK